MMDSLWLEIAAATRHDLKKQKMLLPEAELLAMCRKERPVRDLVKSLKQVRSGGCPFVLGRIQKAEPESGFLRENFDALTLAQNFVKAGAAALAVVTEPHWYLGQNSSLSGVARLVTVPVVRFDCMVERYQIAQAYLWGADAVTLFPAVLDQSELLELAGYAAELKLGVWGIAHSENDMERLLAVESIRIIGAGEEALIEKIPEDKVSVFCGETPCDRTDAWSPERRVMGAASADELQKSLQG